MTMRWYLALLLGGLGLAGLVAAAPAVADACNPRPRVTVTQGVNGAVDIATGYGLITDIQFGVGSTYVGSQANATIDIPGVASGIRPAYDYRPTTPFATIRIYVHPLTAGEAVTVPATITDGCGAWNTFVGAGPQVIPTATPLPSVPTATKVPTSPPTAVATHVTPTTVPIATSTRITTPSVGFAPPTVLQGNTITVSWAGNGNPLVTDFLVLTNQSGVQQGPKIYTSSCATTPGTVAKGQGVCYIQLTTSFAPGQYFVRLDANDNLAAIVAQKVGLTVAASGAAALDRGQAWGTQWFADHPDIALSGGYIGMQAFINAGDPGFITDVSFHHEGVSDFGLLGSSFVEAGALKSCAPLNVPTCVAYPYMSWRDNLGQLQQVVLDGTAGHDDLPLQISTAAQYQFKTFEVAATRWTGEACVAAPFNRCCPIWPTGPFCRDLGPSDEVPATQRIRYAWLFGGQETLDPRRASGLTHINNPAYCCDVAQSNWTRIECWDHAWVQTDPAWVATTMPPCVPFAGWDVLTQYR